MELRFDVRWRAALTPDARALETQDGALTFAQLERLARRGAAWLGTVAPEAARPVALLLGDAATFVPWLHAVAIAGRTVLPLNLRLTVAELAQQLADARADALLGAADDPRLAGIAARLPELAVRTVPALQALPDADSPSTAADDPDAVLAVLYTSGTTGRAKGACLTWRNFAASARATEERLGRAVVSGRWLACMPLFHVGGLSILARSVMYGGPVLAHARFDAAAVSDALDDDEVAAVSLVPTMLSRLLAFRGERPAPAGLQAVLLGGAAAAPRLVRRALAAGYPVCPTYGLTEATSQVATAPPPARGAAEPAPMRPIAGTELRIVVGDDDSEAAPGVPGEITVRGPTVMSGYLHAADATARVLREGWLHTGDVGYVDDGGGLHVLDRRGDLVVTGGENVYPAEVEAVLLEHPAIDEAGVSGLPDDDLGARVVAWVVPQPGATVEPSDLERHCRERLAGYKVPRQFRVVDALPRNAAGKLQRRRLADAGPIR